MILFDLMDIKLYLYVCAVLWTGTGNCCTDLRIFSVFCAEVYYTGCTGSVASIAVAGTIFLSCDRDKITIKVLPNTVIFQEGNASNYRTLS